MEGQKRWYLENAVKWCAVKDVKHIMFGTTSWWVQQNGIGVMIV